jgi:general secretion pathway protein G
MKITPRTGKAAFTLIELMAVITIIVILAGLVVGGMGFVSERQAKEKARVQIALISKALEEYKLDMGTYPPTTDKSSVAAPTGTATSSLLFKALYWDSDNDGAGVPADTDQKIYLPDLDPLTSKQGWTSTPPAPSAATIIVDPWGNQYCYRTAVDATGKANSSTQNPDFDLWSMGKDGKSKPATPSDTTNRDDIKNF